VGTLPTTKKVSIMYVVYMYVYVLLVKYQKKFFSSIFKLSFFSSQHQIYA
jgi:hypothetical protein